MPTARATDRHAYLALGDEPATPLWVEWRLAIYPIAMVVGALALAAPYILVREVLLVVFGLLMLAPLALKIAAWGGLRRTWAWLMQRRLRVTTEGWFFLTLTILFGVAAINTGTNLLYLILSMLLSLIVVSGIVSEVNVKGLRISRSVPRQLYAGDEARLAITLENPKRFVTTFAIEARESIGPFGKDATAAPGPILFVARLRPGDRLRLTYRFLFERRGMFALEGFELATKFPFGFFTKFARAALPSEVVVFPRARDLDPAAVRLFGVAEESLRARAPTFSPDEFKSLRPYRPGDNPRWIHWRSTARVGELVVREFEPRSTHRATVIFDSGVSDLDGGEAPGDAPSPATLALDRGATLCASIVEHLSRLGQQPEVALLLAEGVTRYGSDGGARIGLALLDGLARVVAIDDPGFLRLIDAARPGLRSGSRVIVLSSRGTSEVRRALEREEPAASTSLTVLSFREARDVVALYAAQEPLLATPPTERARGPSTSDALRTSSAQGDRKPTHAA